MKLLNKLLFLIPFISFFVGYYVLSHYFYTTKIIAPSLIGKQISDCAKLLAQERLSIRFLSEQEEPNIQEGTILEQIPKPGQGIRPQQQILVITAKKPATPETPNFFGLSRDQITKLAKAYGFTVRFHIKPSKYPKDTCFAQSPAPHEANTERTVTIFIAEPEDSLAIMPNFYGRSLQEIKAALKNTPAKLEVYYNQASPHAYHKKNVINNQSPMPGSLIFIKKPFLVQVELA